MDALEFFNTVKKMCEFYKGCVGCPLDTCNECQNDMMQTPEESIRIVTKWAKEHPKKTYAQDFAEKFPNWKKYSVCVNMIYFGEDCNFDTDIDWECKRCWDKEMEE